MQFPFRAKNTAIILFVLKIKRAANLNSRSGIFLKGDLSAKFLGKIHNTENTAC